MNKLWNAGKFMNNCFSGGATSATEVEMSITAVTGQMSREEFLGLPLPERFIVSRCHSVVHAVTVALEELRFAEAGSLVHDFLWDEFADWYIEASKVRMRSGDADTERTTRRVLVYVWDRCLRLLHPFMPFLTETLWQLIPHAGDSIMVAEWPTNNGDADLPQDHEAVKLFQRMQLLVVALRNVRSEYNLSASRKTGLVLRGMPDFLSFIQAEADIFCMLARVDREALRFVVLGTAEENVMSHLHVIVDESLDAFVPQDGLVDVVKETARLVRQRDKLIKELSAAELRANNPAFAAKAPPAVVLEARAISTDIREKLAAVQAGLALIRTKTV